MDRKHVLFIADSLDNARKFRGVLAEFGVEVSAGSSQQFARLLSSCASCDLVVFEPRHDASRELATMEQALMEHGGIPLLAIVDEHMLASLTLPAQIRCDFVTNESSEAECALRIRSLLLPNSQSSSADIVAVASMTINLATYQVQIGDAPVDLTYLEYALLAFLVTHAGRTYSRDALLRRVWGFDYYGGSRTVDVHVRRVRAKLGPELAQHLETVRGVGYLWN